MRIFENGTYRNMTAEEIATVQDSRMQVEAIELHRPLTQAEVQDIILKAQVNAVEIADNLSVRMKDYYPTFSEIVGQAVKIGFKFTYNGELFKTLQEMTIQEHYLPETGTESLYVRIDEEHLGNKYDPIPYDGNMALENGKYYSQDGATYLCNRDTGTAVYNALPELVGLYVEVIE